VSTSLEPPNLDLALSTEERAKLLADILRMDADLQHLAVYVRVPETDWPTEIKALFSRSPLETERPADVLRRWWILFQDEVTLLHETRNRLVHQVRVSDAELLRARWLASLLMEVTLLRDPSRIQK
jgi:hypothetical protein